MRPSLALASLTLSAMIYGGGCSQQPNSGSRLEPTPPPPSPPSPPVSKYERLQVAVTNTTSTLIHFGHRSPPPWLEGNRLTIRFTLPSSPGQTEQWVEWDVVNLHADNFAELTRRFGLKTVEVHVFSTTNEVQRVQATGQPERPVLLNRGYAIITDARIPRQWFLAEPARAGSRWLTKLPPQLRQQFMTDFPDKFHGVL